MKRPLGVTVIAVANLLGPLALVASEVLLAEQPAHGGLLGLIALTVLISITVSVALLKMQNWGRWVAVVLYVISLANIPGRVAAARGFADVMSVLLPGLFLVWAVWYLFRPHVKEAFGVS